MSYTLSAILGAVTVVAALGFAVFAVILLDRLADANDRRKIRAATSRDRIKGRY